MSLREWHKRAESFIVKTETTHNTEPEEKVYGPQKCNETVKLCITCDEDGTVCFWCHGRDKWTPIPTTKELWDRVKAVEKAHKDAGKSKLTFRQKLKSKEHDVVGSKTEHTTKPVKGEVCIVWDNGDQKRFFIFDGDNLLNGHDRWPLDDWIHVIPTGQVVDLDAITLNP